MVRAHVAQAGGDAALRGDGVASGREDLRHARGLEPRSGRSHRRAQPGTAGPDDDDVIVVIDNLICTHADTPKAMRARANKASAPPPTARNSISVFSAKLLPRSWT